MQRFVGSKWKKTMALLSDDEIKPYVPKTVRMTSDSLHEMLKEYNMVYIKPVHGTFGNGVMRIEMKVDSSTRRYRYQVGTQARSFHSFDEMYRELIKLTRKREYLVQKGIHLLKHHGRRFDIRVMVQQNLQKQWEATGLIGRVAHPQKIVTNYHSGGTPKDVDLLLTSYMNQTERGKFIGKLKRLGANVAMQLHHRFPGIKEIGVDVAVDKQFKPWILEVNTRPDPYIFLRLRDKRVFAKIVRYVKAYRAKP